MILTFWLLLVQASGLTPPPPVIGPPVDIVEFDLNGSAYLMPVPGSYCVPKVTDASLMKDVTRGTLTISPQAYFVRCDENGKVLGEHEFIYVKYLKGQKLKERSRAEYIASVTPTAQERFDKIFDGDAIAERVENKMTTDAGRTVAIETMKPIPLGHDDTCIYMGLKTSIKIVRTGEKASMLVLTCSTAVDGNLVTVDLASEFDKEIAIAPLKIQLSRAAKSIIANLPKVKVQ